VSSNAPLPHDPPDLAHDRFADFPPQVRRGDLLTVRTAFSEGTYLVAVCGELDLSTVAELRRELSRAEGSRASEIVVDLSALHFIDSTGIRLLLETHTRSQADGNRLRLLRGRAPVQRALEICGLDRELPFLD
jgi:anti-sigma B factor antagonist